MKNIKVCSKIRFNDTGIDIYLDDKYNFSAAGCWWDWFVPSGPNGFLVKKILCTYPVVKGEPYFKLCGCINKDYKTSFAIGKTLLNYEFSHSGRMYLFANDSVDRAKYYENNKGSIEVLIQKVL